jgi:hypothetical protein
MPLSEHEQRLLEQIEQGLEAEDPKFAATVRRVKTRRRSRGRQRVVLAVAGVILGLGVVLLALLSQLVFLGVIGFLILVAGCFLGLLALTDHGPGPAQLGVVDPDGTTHSRGHTAGRTGLRDRMEDRIRRRFDEE